MLPTFYEKSDYSFVVDDRGALRILLVNESLKKQATLAPTEPLWFLEVGDQPSMDAVVAWVRYRRNSWQGWGKLAETAGREALANLLHLLFQKDPPAPAIGMLIESPEQSNRLTLGEMIHSPTGSAKRIYYTHEFASPQERDCFRDWLLSNNPELNGNTLLEIALNDGTGELAEKINKITSDESAKSKH